MDVPVGNAHTRTHLHMHAHTQAHTARTQTHAHSAIFLTQVKGDHQWLNAVVAKDNRPQAWQKVRWGLKAGSQ